MKADNIKANGHIEVMREEGHEEELVDLYEIEAFESQDEDALIPSKSLKSGPGRDSDSDEVETFGGKDVPEDLIPPWRTCIALCTAFVFTYSAFEAIQNLQSSLNAAGHLGVLSLSLMYLFAMLGSLLGPVVARLVGHKNIMVGSFLMHLVYTCVNLWPRWAILLSVSLLLGTAISGLSMSQGVYIASISTSYLHYNHLPPSRLYSAMSFFNGLFFCCFKGTQITGNLMSSVILSSGRYNSSLLRDNKCGAQVCSEFDDDEAQEDHPEESVLHMLFGSYALCNVIGLLIVVFGLPKLENIRHARAGEEKRMERREGEDLFRDVVRKHIGGCFLMGLRLKFVAIIPLTLAQSSLVMIMYTGYTKAFVTCTIGVQWVGYCMVALGLSSACASLLLSSLARYTGRIFLFLLGFAVDLSIMGVMLTWEPDYRTQPAVLLVMPLVAGVGQGTIQPQLQALIGSVFTKSELPSAYAAFNGVKSIAFAIYLAMSSQLCLFHCLRFALAFYLPGIAGYAYIEYCEWKSSRVKGEGH